VASALLRHNSTEAAKRDACGTKGTLPTSSRFDASLSAVLISMLIMSSMLRLITPTPNSKKQSNYARSNVQCPGSTPGAQLQARELKLAYSVPIEKSRLSPKPLPPGIFSLGHLHLQHEDDHVQQPALPPPKRLPTPVTESLVHSGLFAPIDRMGTVFEAETALPLGYTVSNRNSRHKTPGATSSSTSPSTPSSGGLSCLNTNSATRSRSACCTPVGSNILSWIGALSADTSVVSTCLFAVALPISFSPARRIARRAAHSFVRQVARALTGGKSA
jgi:hypothetical protein